MDMLFMAGLLANPFEALGLEWQSIVLHLFNLVILTVGLYFLLFKPVKRMVKERQAKIKKIEKENTELNDEVKKMKESTEAVLSDAKKEAAVIHENAVKVANQKADDIVSSARKEAKSLIERTEQEMEEEHRKLQKDIEQQITDVSLAVAEKILSREVTPEDDKKMIEESLAQWSKE
ncbi:MAG TPA: F0F1 ATP synthase subunit B [Candidatus Borkfalkia excrementipullorum]|nr:F0F1 ATP synthase subunit B [Candidatus Borkfalkia excrementipullorum]